MRTGVFITARLKSSRLKNKIILDLNGKTVIDRIIERAKSVHLADGVVLCTSTNPQDDPLIQHAEKNGIDYFRGSEDDVLDRLLQAAEKFNYDAFVSITADNPLFSVFTSNELIRFYKENQLDFIMTKGIPIGLFSYFIEVKTLKIVIKIKQENDTEIWGPFVNRPDFFRTGELIVKNCPLAENLRLTLDYPEDYELLNRIFAHFPTEHNPSIQEVVQLLTEHPDYLEINANQKQNMLSKAELDAIHNQFEKSKKMGVEYAKELGKVLNPGHFSKEINI